MAEAAPRRGEWTALPWASVLQTPRPPFTLYSVRCVAIQRDPLTRPEAFALLGLSALLIAAACVRQQFIGDGVRHLQSAISSSHPLIGAPRWLLFPTLAWVLIHP